MASYLLPKYPEWQRAQIGPAPSRSGQQEGQDHVVQLCSRKIFSK
jgi:hypothetical protein